MTYQDLLNTYCEKIYFNQSEKYPYISQDKLIEEVENIIAGAPQHIDHFLRIFDRNESVRNAFLKIKDFKKTQIDLLSKLLDSYQLSSVNRAIILLTIDKLKTTIDEKPFLKHLKNTKRPTGESISNQKEKSLLGTYLSSSYGVWGELLIALKVGYVDLFEVTLENYLSDAQKDILISNGLEKAMDYEIDIVYGNHFIEVKYLTSFFHLGQKDNDKLLKKMSMLSEVGKVLSTNENKLIFELALEGPGSLYESTRFLISNSGIKVFENDYLPTYSSVEKAKKNWIKSSN